MNPANYPNKAASWLNGVALGTLTCMQVYRDNNRRSPNYIAVVRDSASNNVRVCSYAAIGKAFSRKDILAARHAFDQGKILGPNPSVAAHQPRPAFATNPHPPANAAFPGFTTANVNDEDAAMAMMTALVRSSRTNPQVANIVKTLATLVN